MKVNVSLSEKEFKKTSLNFRRVASRFLNCNFQDYEDSLKRFLFFIDETSIINVFIQDNNTKKFNIEKMFETKMHHQKFRMLIKENEEIAFIYQLLNYISEHELDIVNISYGYGNSKKIKNHVESFNQQVSKPLVDYIVNYLGELKIDMGLDKKSETQYNIGDFRGQLNHTEGHGKVIANLTYNEQRIDELRELTEQFIEELTESKNIPEDLRFDTIELLEASIQETESEKPKKIIIKTAIEKMKSIGEIATAGTTLANIGIQLTTLLQGVLV